MSRGHDKSGSGSASGGRFTGGATGTSRYSHDDLSYVRHKRGRLEVETGGDEDGELNVVPYLDIMMNLIIFMLVAKAASVSLGMIDITAPSYATSASTAGAPKPEDNPKKLKQLTVAVSNKGFYIGAVGGVLPGKTEEDASADVTADGVAATPPTVPLLPDKSYDFNTLAKKMRAIKNAFEDTTTVKISADQDIPYEVIVATLDATREDSQGLLFPVVAFSKIY